MSIPRHSALAATLAGGALLLAGATPAPAATLVPGLVEPGEAAGVHEVRHGLHHRPDRLGGHRYWMPKNAPHSRRALRPGIRHHGVGIGFGLSAPFYGPRVGFGVHAPGVTFGLGVPYRHHAYGYGRPWW